MKSFSKTRRHIIKTSLAIPLLANLPLVSANQAGDFLVSAELYQEIFNVYGSQADYIVASNILTIRAPDIAENGQVVPISILGERDLVSSVAVFAEKNIKPLIGVFKFKPGSDLAMRLRARISRTSDIYIIAQTDQGLQGVKKEVKVTIGCGGA